MQILKQLIALLIIALLRINGYSQKINAAEKTSFQAAAPWNAAYDVRSDIAMVYGMDSTFTERVKGYRDKGYNVQFMTGIAWGNYQDYFEGRFDGKTHFEEGQVERSGREIGHGKGIPYIVPTDGYIAYFKTLIKKVIDAGVTSIYLEEPEFWARGGYSESFKKEWQNMYGFAWMPQHESPEATYLSSKLKYQLYFYALKEVFQYAKTYSESKGLKVKCYVPTHSLLNYSSWQIVSPEASLAALPGMDGYIAQVWTGTSREPVYFNGVEKERVFENAFLEYGSMLSMTAPTGRKIYFLTDPIEDYPRTWDDYKQNYQATYTAELMYPSVDNFEVMPWPNRIYQGKFKLANSSEKQPISPAYATQMQVMVNALNEMPASANTINGSKGIGVLVGNSMMFQRFPVHNNYDDPQLSNFYGMVMPLLKRGIPVETVHMENLGFAGTLKNIKVLVMSYANMKPQAAIVNEQLAQWVKDGGRLIYYGTDTDPFQTVKEWWNTNGKNYATPSAHLFEQLHISRAGKESYVYGKGMVTIVKQDPKELVLTAGGDENFMRIVKSNYESATTKGSLQTNNYFYLERGPYDIASVMEEGVTAEPLHIQGPVIDMFDPALPVLKEKIVPPGQQSLLYDLKRVKEKNIAQVLCAASRVYDEKRNGNEYSFITKSPSNTNNVMRILLQAKPTSVITKDKDGKTIENKTEWDEGSHTILLQFINDADGIGVEIR
ncbi:hypothetical protein QWZ08_12970 [Ferruginibacter paludis]|uniref:hypothetical protein n=1 Tax=Ferruginibacter paludis TaxID=1310417 RepID=UPI0025B42281|nr:hypothetical protein [Ferruginibacter paludis]MDN3656550.1 hypothetical protein [Ferruginibacter paludis]